MTNQEIASAIVFAILRIGDRMETALANTTPLSNFSTAPDSEIRESTDEIIKAFGGIEMQDAPCAVEEIIKRYCDDTASCEADAIRQAAGDLILHGLAIARRGPDA